MPRVLDLLDKPGPDDEIGFEISAGLEKLSGAGDIVRLAVRVHGSVPMTCQRSLKRYRQPIDSHSSVAVVASEDQLSALPEDLEPKLVPKGRLKLVELVEDELLLALPLVPRDPDSSPVVHAGDSFEGAASRHGETVTTSVPKSVTTRSPNWRVYARRRTERDSALTGTYRNESPPG